MSSSRSLSILLLVLSTGVLLLSRIPQARAAGTTYQVTSTADTNTTGTLRWAINQVNAGAGSAAISFHIGTGGAKTIFLTSDLPQIVHPVSIDGTTQPVALGSSQITLSGTTAVTALHFVAGSDGSSVQGLSVRNCFVGIQVSGTSQVEVGTPGKGNILANNYHALEADNCTSVQFSGNFVGTDAGGSDLLGNGNGIEIFGTTNVVLGGTAAGAGNVICNNTSGVLLYGPGGVRVEGNYIGTDTSRTRWLPNLYGLVVKSAGNTIGGTATGAGNVIAGNNQVGVELDASPNVVLRNRIYNTFHLGLDYGGDSVTPNDKPDLDGVPNFPNLTSAGTDGSTLQLTGALDSKPSTQYTLEFFSNSEKDATGYGEGETYVGSALVATDSAGHCEFSLSLAGGVPMGYFLSATASSVYGTSEFGPDVVVGLPPSISGLVYDDHDGGNYRDGDDGGLAGWTVAATELTSGAVSTVVTRADGFYSFSHPVAGTYRIRVLPPAGWSQVSADPPDVTYTVGSVPNLDFGYFHLRTFSGKVFHHLAGGSDLPLPGITISVSGTPAPLTALTGADGTFAIPNITAGLHTVTVGAAGFTFDTTSPEEHFQYQVALFDDRMDTSGLDFVGNRPPVPTPDTYAVQYDIPLTVPAPGVLANDVDPDGDGKQLVMTKYQGVGYLAMDLDGSFTYYPRLGFSGPDTFHYRVTDGDAISEYGTLTFNVAPMPAGTPGKVTASGTTRFAGIPSTFSVTASFDAIHPLKATLEYRWPFAHLVVKGKTFTALHIEGRHARLFGKASVNGRGSYDFVADLYDQGKPGKRKDQFQLQVEGQVDTELMKIADGEITVR